jgi:hypothetical protein
MGPTVRAFFEPEVRAWRGQQPLWKVFWVYGVAASSVIVALYASAIYAGQRSLQQVLLLVFSAYTVWILVSVWRCADNARERVWGLFARMLTVAWAGNAAMVVLFLELDLLRLIFRR